ncbi:hypothetical protein EDD18DRAFT_1326904 [Armillaria luteobubalina]|uniref:Uncharacterized protein n=1 Tax=Armillaria luteobubalina TaxID=153913 RepID=A0AA39QJK0_9AGAR|nr:hypothetical protein EDD18DRAFT_1326904 [Armillaria luteobubalina]
MWVANCYQGNGDLHGQSRRGAATWRELVIGAKYEWAESTDAPYELRAAVDDCADNVDDFSDNFSVGNFPAHVGQLDEHNSSDDGHAVLLIDTAAVDIEQRPTDHLVIVYAHRPVHQLIVVHFGRDYTYHESRHANHSTTIIITQSNGQQLTSTSTVLASASTSAGAASTTASSSSSSSSHTGAIVGGTIGGIAGLALVGALIWFLYKRNRSNRLSSHFDGNFDPDRIVARPPDVGLNLDDERDNDGMGGRLGRRGHRHGSSGQSYANYYSGSPASPPPMSQYSGEESGYPAAIFNPYAMSIPPRSPPPGSSSSGLGGGAGGMSAKEREARQNQLGVVNPDDRTAYLANGPTGVVQHQDVGPSEIPPAYDSWGAGASGSK